MGATGGNTMRREFAHRGISFRNAGKKTLLFLAAAAIVGCGSDDDATGPARTHFASSISASATGCGLAEVVTGTDTTHVQSYNLTATWQATGTWKAIFVNAGTGQILATTATDATQTKTSVIVGSDGEVSSCQFKKGDIVYAILYPDGSSPVQSDADLTPTLTVGS